MRRLTNVSVRLDETCRERRIRGKSEERSAIPEFLPHTTMTRVDWLVGIRITWVGVICDKRYFGIGI